MGLHKSTHIKNSALEVLAAPASPYLILHNFVTVSNLFYSLFLSSLF